jgi:hypothetical protein
MGPNRPPFANTPSLRAAVLLLVSFALLGGCTTRVGLPDQPLEPVAEPAIGVETAIPFDVKDRWNDHGIQVIEGHHYRFMAEVENWVDKDIDASPSVGWQEQTPVSMLLGPFSSLRACPSENWYALVGVIVDAAGNEHCFTIGSGLDDWTATATGRLLVIANDYPSDWTYANNQGRVQLSITRTR